MRSLCHFAMLMKLFTIAGVCSCGHSLMARRSRVAAPVRTAKLLLAVDESVPAARQRNAVTVWEAVKIPAPADGPPSQDVCVVDLTPDIRRLVAKSGLRTHTDPQRRNMSPSSIDMAK